MQVLISRLTWEPTQRLRNSSYNADRGVIISSISPLAGNADLRVEGASLNLDYAPTGNVLLRVEGRVLDAQDNIFQQKDGRPSDRYGNVTSSLAISF